MKENTDWVIVGRFGRTHGIKGFIKIYSFTEPRDNILNYTDWYAYINKQWQPLKITKLEVNDKSIIAKVKGYAEREQVACLTNVDIGIDRQQLPKLGSGEYYWDELIGMQVIGQNGELFGKVTEILSTGANDVLVVEGEKRYLIPYLLDQYVKDVNPEQNRITVDWDMDF